MLSARALILPLALAAGCSVTEKSYPKDYAKAFCSFEKRCAKTECFYDYNNEQDCEDKWLTYWDEYGDSAFANCSFNASKAQECLDAMDQSCKRIADDYDTFDPTCDEAWDCSSGYGE